MEKIRVAFANMWSAEWETDASKQASTIIPMLYLMLVGITSGVCICYNLGQIGRCKSILSAFYVTMLQIKTARTRQERFTFEFHSQRVFILI
jgi:hypothetical protein